MDPVTLVYYGTICGLLALLAPSLATPVRRFAFGVLVGLVAAGVLPALRSLAMG